jgi:hypothetical protein
VTDQDPQGPRKLGPHGAEADFAPPALTRDDRWADHAG